jgi:hypothetical protein
LNRIVAGWPAWKWAVTVVVALVAAVAASVLVSRLAGKDGGTVATGQTGQPTPSATAPVATTDTAGGTVSVPVSPAPGRTTATTRATPAGPQIVTFRVKTSPSCPAGTNLNPIDGTPVTLEWEVAGAESTVLAVDGPGKYGDFKVKDSLTLSFPCSGPPNSEQKHTYTLTTVGGGPVATQTLTVTAKVNEIAIVSTP